jgi:hypothetical protein
MLGYVFRLLYVKSQSQQRYIKCISDIFNKYRIRTEFVSSSQKIQYNNNNNNINNNNNNNNNNRISVSLVSEIMQQENKYYYYYYYSMTLQSNAGLHLLKGLLPVISVF